MNKYEKIEFINSIIKNIHNGMLEDIDKVPEHWDGMKLRLWIRERFSEVVWRNVTKQQRMDFINDTIEHNI